MSRRDRRPKRPPPPRTTATRRYESIASVPPDHRGPTTPSTPPLESVLGRLRPRKPPESAGNTHSFLDIRQSDAAPGAAGPLHSPPQGDPTYLGPPPPAPTLARPSLTGPLLPQLPTTPLTGLQDGQPKVFRDTAITNSTEFFDRFRRLNVRSNPELDALVDQARQVITGTEPQQLRDSVRLRQTVANDFTRIEHRSATQAAPCGPPTHRMRGVAAEPHR